MQEGSPCGAVKYGRGPCEIRCADEIHSTGMDEIFAYGKCCGAKPKASLCKAARRSGLYMRATARRAALSESEKLSPIGD